MGLFCRKLDRPGMWRVSEVGCAPWPRGSSWRGHAAFQDNGCDGALDNPAAAWSHLEHGTGAAGNFHRCQTRLTATSDHHLLPRDKSWTERKRHGYWTQSITSRMEHQHPGRSVSTKFKNTQVPIISTKEKNLASCSLLQNPKSIENYMIRKVIHF